jgi:hypothetical protein
VEGEFGKLAPYERAFPMKDGRTAIFDTRTKKFIRWAQ